MKQGFSLIELLVVVAIFGILSTVGLVAYQLYIDNTKDEVAIDAGNFVQRTLNQDVISIQNNLRARSELAADINMTSECYKMVHDLVETVNGTSSQDGRSSPFNENEGILCNGIQAAAENSGGQFVLPRGKTIIYCDGLDPSAHIVNLEDNFNVRTCTCYESDCDVLPIDTTVGAEGSSGYRCIVELTSPYSSSSDTAINFTNAETEVSSGCMAEHDTVYIAGTSDSFSVSGCDSDSCNTTYQLDLDNGTKLYTEEDGRCYYPWGGTWSFQYSQLGYTDANSYSRHSCVVD